MTQTPLSERLRVVFAGPRNAGKSSLMNALFGREVALVSDIPGTTTDPVTRSFEIPGLGPAAITDTPGIDDEGVLGDQRVRLAMNRAESADLRVFVTPSHLAPGEAEQTLFEAWFAGKSGSEKPTILVFTHSDRDVHPDKASWSEGRGAIRTEAPDGRGIDSLVAALSAARPEREPTPLEGLVKEGDLVLLVTPIDLAAPAGRLITPQVQTIRDALDRDASALMVKERELYSTYRMLGKRPKLVVTDSQAFSKAAADIPEDQMLTSFSILFARKKGDLAKFLAGLAAAAKAPRSPKVLILESCAHHRQADDIGTVKIPRLFRQLVRDDAEFSFERGLPNEAELGRYDLVIHCGACSITRGAMAARLERLESSGVPVTNYGLFLAWVNGLLPRALEPFPDAMEAWTALFA
ncbi:MAG: [FeFe] hydrogenase H-cluster maturation GTPase HydF [Spirochaetaceae bacterium]|nr:[FeFe] hydrogenase H-cluster maturation GTPase HydF [Spirochaetaceae bacterium]MDT8298996.1 [FeFe] hydrogenase H-cluster maturation GTPase HydF [Spirochaetaceae bacterium]